MKPKDELTIRVGVGFAGTGFVRLLREFQLVLRWCFRVSTRFLLRVQSGPCGTTMSTSFDRLVSPERIND